MILFPDDFILPDREMIRPLRPKEPLKEFLSFEGRVEIKGGKVLSDFLEGIKERYGDFDQSIAEFDIWRNSDGSVRLNLDGDRILCLKIYKRVTNPVYDEQMNEYKKKLEEYEVKRREFDEWVKNSGFTATEILDRFGFEE